MANSLFDPSYRKQVIQRIEKLTPETHHRWGQMNARQVVHHLSLPLKAGMGRYPVTADGPKFLRGTFGKLLVIYIMPWPKGKTPTAKEFDMVANNWTGPEFDEGKAELLKTVNEFVSLPESYKFPEHPAFGHMTRKQWGDLQGRHFDHHLSQFGV